MTCTAIYTQCILAVKTMTLHTLPPIGLERLSFSYQSSVLITLLWFMNVRDDVVIASSIQYYHLFKKKILMNWKIYENEFNKYFLNSWSHFFPINMKRHNLFNVLYASSFSKKTRVTSQSTSRLLLKDSFQSKVSSINLQAL